MGAEKTTAPSDVLGELQLSAFGEMVTQFSSKITTSLTSYLELKSVHYLQLLNNKMDKS